MLARRQGAVTTSSTASRGRCERRHRRHGLDPRGRRAARSATSTGRSRSTATRSVSTSTTTPERAHARRPADPARAPAARSSSATCRRRTRWRPARCAACSCGGRRRRGPRGAVGRGVECSEITVFDERDGGTFFGFADPDGNTWAVQQIKVRGDQAADPARGPGPLRGVTPRHTSVCVTVRTRRVTPVGSPPGAGNTRLRVSHQLGDVPVAGGCPTRW